MPSAILSKASSHTAVSAGSVIFLGKTLMSSRPAEEDIMYLPCLVNRFLLNKVSRIPVRVASCPIPFFSLSFYFMP